MAALEATGLPDDEAFREAIQSHVDFGSQVAMQNSHAETEDQLHPLREVPDGPGPVMTRELDRVRRTSPSGGHASPQVTLRLPHRSPALATVPQPAGWGDQGECGGASKNRTCDLSIIRPPQGEIRRARWRSVHRDPKCGRARLWQATVS
jgi:hypothetical protein